MQLDNDLPMLDAHGRARLPASAPGCSRTSASRASSNVPRKGAVILAINHISNADAFVTGAWITPACARRRIHWLGKRELFDWPVFGWMAARGGIHPVDRSTADVEAFRLATRILEAGRRPADLPRGHAQPRRRAPGAEGRPRDRSRCARTPRSSRSASTAATRSGRRAASSRSRSRAGRSRSASATPFRVADVVPAGADRRAAKSHRDRPRSWAGSPRCSTPGTGAPTRPRSDGPAPRRGRET